MDRESLGLVGLALITLGLDPAFVDNVWQKEILNKYTELAESQMSKVADAVHHHMKNCLDGNFGSLDKAQADKVLLLLPGKTPLKQHLSQFFKVVREVGQLLMQGSLSNASKIASTLSSLEQLKQNEAAFGQELKKIGACPASEDSAGLSNFFEKMAARLKTVQASKVSKTQNDIRKAITATIDIINGVRVTSQKEFRTDMKKVGSQLAAKQKNVKTLMTLLEAECPNIQAESEAAQPDDQSVACLYKKAKSAESKCTEYTSVFVAFQIWGSDGLHKDTVAAGTLRSNLARALSARTACGELTLFLEEVEEISKRLSERKDKEQTSSSAAEDTAGTAAASER